MYIFAFVSKLIRYAFRQFLGFNPWLVHPLIVLGLAYCLFQFPPTKWLQTTGVPGSPSCYCRENTGFSSHSWKPEKMTGKINQPQFDDPIFQMGVVQPPTRDWSLLLDVFWFFGWLLKKIWSFLENHLILNSYSSEISSPLLLTKTHYQWSSLLVEKFPSVVWIPKTRSNNSHHIEGCNPLLVEEG